ncbi:hypothetical protein [Xanthovirga aplysinae]|uniref:hypothetical protein n=1 Tax=Xanthovirga aplysinae TaxID=2529853 RepID=UPI0012BD5876|nr:hypothetical protein [Xanthovirga aplysinae]MTI29788.1 hypothetical protein [Xanthovirga aplysinae]
MDKIDQKELTHFFENLKFQIREKRQKARYMHEHNFKKEQEYIQTKIEVAESIRFGIEWLKDGKKGAEIDLEF